MSDDELAAAIAREMVATMAAACGRFPEPYIGDVTDLEDAAIGGSFNMLEVARVAMLVVRRHDARQIMAVIGTMPDER